MVRVLKLVSVLCFLSFSSQKVFGLVNGNVFYGMYKGDYKPESSNNFTLDGSQMTAAVYVDPIPLLPVGFGLSLQVPDVTGKVDGNDVSYTGLTASLSLKVWSPISFAGFTPYARMGYVVYGAGLIELSSQQMKQEVEVSGLHLGAGVRYSVIPFVGLLFEVESQNESVKTKEIKQKIG